MSNDYIAVFTAITLIGLIYLLFWRYKAYRLDVFRQDMFELRDELFDYALEGNIEFNDNSYGMLRSTINGFIRFGHKLSLGQIIVFIILLGRKHKYSSSFNNRWKDAIKNLEPKVNKQMEIYLSGMHYAVLNHLIIRSPEIIITIIPFIILYLFGKTIVRNFRNMLIQPVDAIDTVAYSYGGLYLKKAT